MAGLFENLIEFGLKQYDKRQPREELPLNKQVFLETVLDNNKEPITEGRLSNTQKQALQQLVMRKYSEPGVKTALTKYQEYLSKKLEENEKFKKAKNKDKVLYPQAERALKEDLEALTKYRQGVLSPQLLKIASGQVDSTRADWLGKAGVEDWRDVLKLKPYIQYKDYNINQQETRNVFRKFSDEETLATFLGQFNFDIDPTTNALVIKDTYDFNPPKSTLTGQAVQHSSPGEFGAAELPAALDTGGSGLYGIVRDYAGSKIPPGQGREVILNLNQTGFEPTIK
jgi:hypothetical protein